MGCFLGCFGGSKDRRRRNQGNRGSPRRQRNGGQSPLLTTVSPVLGITEKATNSVPELSDKSELKLSPSTRKRVTFDSNVQTYEHVAVYGSTDSLLENNNFSEREKEKDLAKSRQSYTNSEDDSTISSVGSYPQNHRYQNCRDSDDEAVESEYEDSDLDDDYDDYDEADDEGVLCQEVWSETIPTASMESRTENSLTRMASQEVDSPMTCEMAEKEVKTIGLNRNARDRSVYVHPVLNPVENLSQWKAVKSRGTLPLKPQQKENLAADEEVARISFSSEPSFKQSSYSLHHQSNHQAKNLNKDIAVDASLSNWLVSSEITPKKKTATIELGSSITSEKSMSQGSTSVISIEDRPILGALTLEELKQFSASNSPRKSPSRSPDDMPIMGTVGTYWKHTVEAKGSGSGSSYKGIPNTTSKYREDKKVNWNSTPFETRLERALT